MDFSDWVSVVALAVSGLALWRSYSKDAMEMSISTENAPEPKLTNVLSRDALYYLKIYRENGEGFWRIISIKIIDGQGKIILYTNDVGHFGFFDMPLRRELDGITGEVVATRRKHSRLEIRNGVYLKFSGDIRAIKVTVADIGNLRRRRAFKLTVEK